MEGEVALVSPGFSSTCASYSGQHFLPHTPLIIMSEKLLGDKHELSVDSQRLGEKKRAQYKFKIINIYVFPFLH